MLNENLLVMAMNTDLCVSWLFIFQSVHEPTGPSESYLQLEELVKQVVSPFLGISGDRSFSGPTYTLGKECSSQVVKRPGDHDTSTV